MLGASAALASQGSGCMPTTGTVSGLTLVTDINAGIKALISSNSGSSAPATDCSGLSLAGQFWLDTSTTPYVLKNYDGTSWLTLGTMDNTNHVWTPPIGGGTNSVTAAGTTDLCSVPQGYVTISGNTTITAFGSSCVAGQIKYLNFTGTPQVTYNGTSLIIPGAATITVAAGDQAVAAYLGSGNWRIVSYTPTSGQALVNPSFPAGFAAYGFAFTAPSGWALSYGQNVSRATFATLLSATTLAQSGVRTSGSPIITSLSDTSQFRGNQPVEGTGIPGGTLILTVDSGTQITLNANATSSGTSTVTVFPNGNGDGSTTFGLPDCRSVVMAGRGNMGGSNRNLLTNTYLQASGTGLGAFGGVDHQTIGTANLPPYTPTGNVQSFTPAGTISAPTITLSAAATNVVNSSSGGGANLTGGGGALLQGTITASASTPVFTGNLLAPNFIGIAQGGTSTPIATVQPTIIANCFIKLTN
jgi:hypothetical protein